MLFIWEECGTILWENNFTFLLGQLYFNHFNKIHWPFLPSWSQASFRQTDKLKLGQKQSYTVFFSPPSLQTLFKLPMEGYWLWSMTFSFPVSGTYYGYRLQNLNFFLKMADSLFPFSCYQIPHQNHTLRNPHSVLKIFLHFSHYTFGWFTH